MKKNTAITTLFIILLLSLPITGTRIAASEKPSRNGTTFYVGGHGPNNYTSIQAAINASSDGDTVYVFHDSSPYDETLNVTKSINLVGENNSEVTIWAEDFSYAIQIHADYSTVQGFKIIASGHNGIQIDASYVTVTLTSIFSCNNFGISLGSNEGQPIVGTTIKNNTISDNHGGIILKRSLNGTIENNLLTSNIEGLIIQESYHNIIQNNTIQGRDYGIRDLYSGSNLYTKNLIENNLCGIYFWASTNNKIVKNTFFRNFVSARFDRSPLYVWYLRREAKLKDDTYFLTYVRLFGPMTWERNYWDQPRILPYPIFGKHEVDVYYLDYKYPLINFDWRPALRPYHDIDPYE